MGIDRSRTVAARDVSTVLLLALCIALGLAAGPSFARTASATPAHTAAHRAAHRSAQHRDRLRRARAALRRAKLSLAPDVSAADRPDASVALRRLWLLRNALPQSELVQAKALSQRPPSDQVDCSSPIACVHWTSGETTPAWAAQVRDTVTHVGETYRAAGYRSPLPDHGRGGSSKTDVYITDLPPELYGYCTSDQAHASKPGHDDVWAYCVLDNDYAGFPAHTPVENLEVTTAHEFYHAVQFSYDIHEDRWLMEATAVTMEDELYPDVNDNVQYLARSPITRPSTSLDTFRGIYPYGTWNFIRYLIEQHPQTRGGLPVLLLRLWRDADSSHGPSRDLYSVQALDKALRRDKTTLADAFARYSDATRRTHTTFAEGAALDYPVKEPAGEKTIDAAHPRARFSGRLNHLASATYRVDVDPSIEVGQALDVRLGLPDRVRGSEAVLSSYKIDGGVRTRLLRLGADGDADVRVRRLSGLQALEVTVVNASTRYAACYERTTPFSCSGRPVDQDQPHRVTVSLTTAHAARAARSSRTPAHAPTA